MSLYIAMTITDIQNLIDLLNEAPTVYNLSVKAADGSEVTIKRAPAAYAPPEIEPFVQDELAVPVEEPAPETTPVFSTRVGFFQAASPAVQVGDRVKTGQRLGIVESMSIKNDVTALSDGIVLSIFVEDGQPVEYGQALFDISSDAHDA